jgi:hypothetical protein
MRSKGPSENDAKKWDDRYKEVEAFHKKHGHSNVPSTLKNKLSRWVEHQRQNHRMKESKLTAERIARLDKLGFRWATKKQKVSTKLERMRQESWLEMYEELKAFKKKHGHCKVPKESNNKDLDPLGSWVTIQRRSRIRMPQNRKDLLDKLDFLWVTDNWDAMYEELLNFKQEHGHTEVPGNKSSLDHWCRKQRSRMRKNELAPERRDRMEELGFNIELKSEKNERIWNAKFLRLKKFKRKHGNCLVPSKTSTSFQSDVALSFWVGQQRTNYKRGIIPDHRREKLEKAGFVWSIVERGPQRPTEAQEVAWEKSYEKLRDFYEANGHFIVPYELENGKLNPLTSWVLSQRRFYALGQIKEDRREKLDTIGFIWNQATEHFSQLKWNAAFEELAKFREAKGHTFVGRDDGMTLWRWTKTMAQKHERSTLSPEKEERLKAIGFWNPRPAGYQKGSESNVKPEDVVELSTEEECWSSEADDDRKPAAKRRKTSEDDDDDRKPAAKRRQTSEDDDDDRKPAAKRSRTTPTSEDEEEGEDEELSSTEDEDDDDDDRKPAAKRRRTASTSDEEDEDLSSTEDEDDDDDDDDRKRTSKRQRATLFEAAELKSLLSKYSVGTKVKAFFEGHGWFMGKITSIDEDYSCYVRYTDGDEETYRLDEYEELDQIVANAVVSQR